MLFSETLPIELTNGNDGRGNKWCSSSRVRKKIEEILRLMGHEREPIDGPCCVHITRILGPNQRLWDADSILRGNAKELLDALVSLGWFVDDGPKWIKQVVGFQDDARRNEGPSVVVTVFTDDRSSTS